MIDLGWLTVLCPFLAGFAWGGGSPSAPPPPPPPPSKSDAEIQADKAKAAKVARNRKGRGASILTGEGTNFLQPDDGGQKTTLG